MSTRERRRRRSGRTRRVSSVNLRGTLWRPARNGSVCPDPADARLHTRRYCRRIRVCPRNANYIILRPGDGFGRSARGGRQVVAPRDDVQGARGYDGRRRLNGTAIACEQYACTTALRTRTARESNWWEACQTIRAKPFRSLVPYEYAKTWLHGARRRNEKSFVFKEHLRHALFTR